MSGPMLVCHGGAGPPANDQPGVDKAADAGWHTIWFGIESGDEEYRSKMLGRKMTNQQVIDAAINCKKAGINRLTFNIVGMPLETARNKRETLRLNQQISPEHFFFFPYIPLRGTPLYNTAKQEGLLITNKRNLHYLSAANDRKFTLNMKEQPELLTATEYNDICMEMLQFQETNNRLSYSESEEGEASVEDKSFSLVEEKLDSTQQISSLVARQQSSGLIETVKNLFRS